MFSLPEKDAEYLLKEGMEALSIEPRWEELAAFTTYLGDLKKWNRAYNLSGMKTDHDIVVKHFLDSLLFLRVLPTGTDSVADVGSGPGFPGIPMKIVHPHLKVFLIEPVQKKALFLRHIIHRLQLRDIIVMDKRIEEIRGIQVDAAVTRALFTAGDFIQKADRIIKEKGVFILSKGPAVEKELKILQTTHVIEKIAVELPVLGITRYLVVIRKISPAPEIGGKN